MFKIGITKILEHRKEGGGGGKLNKFGKLHQNLHFIPCLRKNVCLYVKSFKIEKKAQKHKGKL